MSAWQVKLPRFEGPLDLLLFLVSRQEYDISDLPMAEITESYLGVVDAIGIEDLEDAGEYLLMAATLLSIKAKLLLPRPPQLGEEEVEDPRRELANRLLLYQKVKEEAARFGRREDEMLERWEIGYTPVPAAAEPSPDEMLVPMTIYDLSRAIEELLMNRESRTFHQVKLHRISLEERMRWVVDLVAELERFGLLHTMQTERERMIWVVTLLAILELAKRQRIHVDQNEAFAEIYVSGAQVPEVEAA
ncbi:segregation/condensation protein A [candidate division KSB1 bacterium]|nr:segregation/condensation protein A [candidate division KSB1 bacterium]